MVMHNRNEPPSDGMNPEAPLMQNKSIEPWKELEFNYAKQLRESNALERRHLYSEAYTAVSELVQKRFYSDDPEERTAGTSRSLVVTISKIVANCEDVLEIGCGRGYTCLLLAPFVKSIVGIEVSESSVAESKKVLSQNRIDNVEIIQVSAMELINTFGNDMFNVCISIDVIEHLHPEDAEEHIKQVFQVLKPGGRYMIITPNRLNGPHDITKSAYPESKKALGFHLNEVTYRDLTQQLNRQGFHKFQIFYPLNFIGQQRNPILLPYQFIIIFEILFSRFPNMIHYPLVDKILGIRLIAHKPLVHYIGNH